MNLKRSLALAISVLMILTMPFAFGAGETLDRIAGSNRWETAVKISQEGWTSAGTVILANGRNYPDALAGVPLAYGLDAPVLLTEADSLVVATKAEITRLGAGKVIILGGTGVISAAVEEELKEMGLNVERIKGADRFETAANVAMAVAPAGVDTVVLASGRGYADALAAGSYAAVKGYPILLTEKNSLPDATKKAIEDLGVTNVIVVGGTGVIADSAITGLPGVYRVSGSNREATSVELAKYFGPQTNMFYLATGDGFADAITGAVLAAKEGTGILLVRSSLAAVTSDFFANAQVVNAVIFGGTGSVSDAVAKAAAAKLVPAGGTGVAGWVTNGAGATVSIGGQTAKVNDTNFFRVVGVAPGEHTLTITKADHSPKKVAVKVVKDNISILYNDLATIAQNQIHIVGSVVDKATGLSLDAVTISFDLWNAKDNKWENKVDSTSIEDGTGVFDFVNTNKELDFGDKVRVNVSVDGYHSVSRVITLAQYSEANVLDGFELTKIKTMVLSGKVTSGTTLIEGAQVVLYDADDNALTPDFDLYDESDATKLLTETTDSDGLFALPKLALPSGTYTLKVKAAGYAIGAVAVSISEGVDKTQNVALAKGYNVTFTLAPTASLGSAFASGNMKATLLKNNEPYDSITNVAATGTSISFAFDQQQVAPGTYTLRITGDHVKTSNYPINVVKANVTAYGSADFAGAVSGTITVGDAGGKAKVELLNKAGAVVATTNSKADGTYKFTNLAAGQYKIQASKEGYITKKTDTFTAVAVNATAGGVDLTIPANPTQGTIKGTIRTAGTLLPAYVIIDATTTSAATISYYALSSNISDGLGDVYEVGDLVQSADVADDGSYEFTNPFYPGTYTVVIRHPGYHETLVTTQAIAAGDELAKNYLLTPGGNGKIVLSLVDEDGAAITTADIIVEDANGEKMTVTGPAGEVTDYVISDLSAGTYTITATLTDYLNLEVPVTIAKGATATREIEMTPVGASHIVTVGVTGVDHGVLEAVELAVFDADGKALTFGTPVTDTTGVATFSVVNGTYKVGFYLHGYLYAEHSVTVKDADISMPVVILTKW